MVRKLRFKDIFLSLFLVLPIVLLCAGCTNSLPAQRPGPGSGQSGSPTPVPTPTPIDLSDAFPPATPLTCPGTPKSVQAGSFVQSLGGHLLYNGSQLKLSGFTFYPTAIGGSSAWRKADFTDYIAQMLDLGSQAGQNLIRPTDFWDQQYQDNRSEDALIWKNMDYLVCTAQQRGLFIEMDVSAFRWFLQSQKQDPFNPANWTQFLEAVGKHYSTQKTIAFYSILGEASVPQTVTDMNNLVNFYRVTTTALRSADPDHLIMAGGFNHMEDDSPALPWWQEIYGLPNNDLVGFKTYSQDDLNLMPEVSAYAAQIRKPAIDEEFGMPQDQGDLTASGQTYNGLQISRSQFFDDVYRIGTENTIAGFVFWNLGCEMGDTDYEVSPETPAVWHVIQQYAPVPLAAPTSQSVCT